MKFKNVPGFPGYQCSRCGIARSVTRRIKDSRGIWKILKGKTLSPRLSRGYPCVVLCAGECPVSIRVHVIVALTWVGERPRGFDISHKDGNKLNNHSCNLEYLTRGEHIRRDRGRSVIRSDGVQFRTIAEAAMETCCSSGAICNVCKGTCKTGGGFEWKYAK